MTIEKIALVTGGAGFIGSHLVEALLADGYRVRVVDNLSNGREENISHLKNDARLSFEKKDVAEYGEIAGLFAGVTHVFHLAALADIVPSIQRPLEYHRSNVDGTVNVLEASRQAGVKRFVYAASSSCYGIPDLYPTPEAADIRPMYPYALTKYLGEEAVMHWCKVYGLAALSLRFFNVYGPRSRTAGTYGAVFGVFLAQKINNQPYTVVGDGTQTRDFTFVTDVVRALKMAGESKLAGEIMNVGSGNTYSVNLLVELMGGEKVYVPKRPGEPDCTFAEVSKIEHLLGWRAEVSFETGVKIMLDNIDYWKNAPVWTASKIEVATKDWHRYLGRN